MKLGTLALILALVAAPACGGGGGADAGPGGSPTPIAASFVPDQPSPASNTVAMAEGSRMNDIVTVNVTLTGTNGVYGTAFELVYDSTHTSYVDFAPGTVFEQGGGAPTYLITAKPGATPPRVVVGISRTGSSGTNVMGTKVVVSLQFRVKQAGVFPMSVENAVVFDSQTTPQPIPGIAWFAGAVEGV